MTKRSVEELLINGFNSRRIIIYLYESKIDGFETALLEANCGFNSGSHYHILMKLEELGIIKKFPTPTRNKKYYQIIDKVKLEELVKKIAEKL